MITDKLLVFCEHIWGTSLALAPWLLLGLGIAGILHLWIPDNFVKRHLGHGRSLAVFKAVLFGVPMPLCSCGVIPAALGIKKQGAGDGAALGFLISTPQTGIDSIMVSMSMLGLPFAIFKLVSAFIIGIIGGLLAYFSDSALAQPLEEEDNSTTLTPRTVRELFNFAIDDLLKIIWRWLLLGIIISAAITTWLPGNLFQDYLSDNILVAMLLVLLISLPMYVCATASVPIAAALVAAGMPPGAALVFLMAGPASNIATIGTVYRVFGIKKLFIYLGSIIIGSLLCGWLFNSVISTAPVKLTMQHHPSNIISASAAVILLILMLRFAVIELHDWLHHRRQATAKIILESRDYYVDDISCQLCASKIVTALTALDEVSDVQVEVASGIVTVRGRALDDDILLHEIRKSGFTPITD